MSDKPYARDTFVWDMRRYSPSTLSEDTEFLTYAARLSTKFAVVDIPTATQDRTGLADYLDYVRLFQGLDRSVIELQRFVDGGLMASIEAVIVTRLCRNNDDHGRATRLLSKTYARSDGDPYVGHLYAEALASTGELSELDFLAATALMSLRKNPNEVLANRWVDLLLSMMRVDSAEELMALLPSGSDSRQIFAHRIGTYRAPSTPLAELMPTTVINLASETRKMSLSAALLGAAGHRIHRHDAVAGATMPSYALGLFSPDQRVRDIMSPGSIACALSHYAAWESLTHSGEESMLIVEDDAGPYTHSSVITQAVETCESDILYVNERMSEVFNTGRLPRRTDTMTPWAQCEGWYRGRKGWGFDGYVLTRRGAERALAIVDRLGMRGHVDGQFGAYSTTPSGEATNDIQRLVMRFRAELPEGLPLTGACLRMPAIKANPFGVTSTVTAGVSTHVFNSSLS
jgi:GR25 family glycosyltransferase involved in LPS biosynthesis